MRIFLIIYRFIIVKPLPQEVITSAYDAVIEIYSKNIEDIFNASIYLSVEYRLRMNRGSTYHHYNKKKSKHNMCSLPTRLDVSLDDGCARSVLVSRK